MQDAVLELFEVGEREFAQYGDTDQIIFDVDSDHECGFPVEFFNYRAQRTHGTA